MAGLRGPAFLFSGLEELSNRRAGGDGRGPRLVRGFDRRDRGWVRIGIARSRSDYARAARSSYSGRRGRGWSRSCLDASSRSPGRDLGSLGGPVPPSGHGGAGGERVSVSSPRPGRGGAECLASGIRFSTDLSQWLVLHVLFCVLRATGRRRGGPRALLGFSRSPRLGEGFPAEKRSGSILFGVRLRVSREGRDRAGQRFTWPGKLV